MNAYEWGVAHCSCAEALEWRRSLGPAATQSDAWRLCQRSDWMLWCLRKIKYDGEAWYRLFSCDYAERLLLRDREAGRLPDPASWEAVLVAREFAAGRATREQLTYAARAAYDAARAAAAHAAYAAADAARAAAAYDSDAAAAAAAAAAFTAERAWQADRIRHYLPLWPEKGGEG